MNRIDNALHDEMRAWRHDIHKHPELGFAEARTAATVTGLLEGFGLEVHPGIGTTGVVAFCAVAALAGLGVIVQPSFIIGDDVARGALQRVLADFTPREATIHAVFPHNRHLSAKVRVFVDFLVDRFAPEPYWDVAADVGADAA